MKKILNYGSLNIDMVFSVEHFVRSGETISAKEVNIFPGGKGLNQSIAISRAGAKVCHLGKVGSDGVWLSQLLKENGVNTDFVSTKGSLTGTAMIQVSQQGDNCIIINHGANGENTAHELFFALSGFGKGDIFLVQNETNEPEAAIDAAIKKGMEVALNPSPIDENIKKINLNKITYLFLNEIEGEALSGQREPKKICAALLERYSKLKIVLTLGENGVLYKDADTEIYEKAVPVKAVDTTAAGDTFTGYFLAEMVLTGKVERALKQATIASSITVSRRGAAKSIPFREEVNAFGK
jgi:ribokinase